ncbi:MULTISPECIES: hypothetical protein [unclassified Virgibacillus]|uniref:hypothetical protein n=1 Tax=unclassified Virgibacillus TaxID=2620237 RepID=UPI00090CD550|nr:MULTISPECIES: hypothetical protein [unclassified Virgibacillus]API94000.1 hypothetical protein BKP57_20520 [Virgibacillus sp. 6R]MBS7427444.1 hypothetical protein [Virgibacillus sp. 19R1-5]
MNKTKDLTFAEFMGLIFIIIGVIGFITIITSFDHLEYSELKDSAYLLDEEEVQLEMMKDDLMSTWVVGIGTLLINVAIGVVLMTMGKIVRLLQEIRGPLQTSEPEHKESNE